MTRGRIALLAGGTGLVGGHLLELLLAEPRYERVITLVRRATGRPHERLEERLVDFEDLPRSGDPPRAHDVFCCLGTTIGKAGSRETFRRVDHDYVLELARLARAAGAEAFLLVSAQGADAASRIFYSRVKGEVEEAVAALGLPALHIFRPGLLLGERQESRPAERLGMVAARLLDPLMVGPLRPYRAVEARRLAAAMVAAALTCATGRHLYTYEDIARLAPG